MKNFSLMYVIHLFGFIAVSVPPRGGNVLFCVRIGFYSNMLIVSHETFNLKLVYIIQNLKLFFLFLSAVLSKI